MPKNLIQDIVKIKTVKKDMPPVRKETWYDPIEEKLISFQGPTEQKPNRGKFKYKLWLVALVSVIALLFAISFLFASATVNIVPKTQDINLNKNLSAVKDGSTDAGLSFELVVISGEEDKTVQGGEAKDVLTSAKGVVVIYNKFSSSPQVFSKDTRLEGSNGKIYKTVFKVTVPGIAKDGSPGKIETNIYASSAGEEYNSAPIDFKIFGFKGTAKYSKFDARSRGDITGGLKGKYYQISDTQKTILSDELKNTLLEKLFQKVIGQIPDGFILFKDAAFLNIVSSNIDTAFSLDGNISLKMMGTFYGFLFNEKKLTKTIAENVLDQYDGSGIHIPDIKNLIFSLSDKEISFADAKKIDFNLLGPLKIVWDIDPAKLIADLLGKNKRDFSKILSVYFNIDSADVKFHPFWIMSFPEKENNIEIIVNEPK